MAESIIKVLIKGDEFDLKRATEAAHKDLEKAGESHNKFAGVAKAAMAGAGLAAVAFVASSVKVASEFQEAHDRMDQAFRVTGVAGGKWVEDAEKQGAKFGYTRDKIDNALASSVRALGSATKAHKALNIAEDIAAATGMDLQSATMMVVKAQEGNTKALKKLGIEYTGATGGAKAVATAQKNVEKSLVGVSKAQAALAVVEMKVHAGVLKGIAGRMALMQAHAAVSKATDGLRGAQDALGKSQHAGDAITDLLAKKYKGSAADASKTFAGQMKALHAQFVNFQATVGAKVIPILQATLKFFMDHKPILMGVVAALALLVAGFVAFKIGEAAVKGYKAAVQVAKGVQAAFNLVMDANPIMLVVLALAAVAAGVIYAYKHFKWFHDFVQKAWEVLQTGFDWVKSHWPLLLAILTGPIGIAVYLIIHYWDQIWGAVKGVASKIAGIAGGFWSGITGAASSAVGWIKGIWDGIYDYFTKLPGRLVSGLGNIVGIVTGPFRSAFNAVAGLWNRTVGQLSFSIPDWVPFVGGKGFSMPKIPTMHTGGIFNSDTGQGLALLRNGEGVFTPEQMRAMGGSVGGSMRIINNFPAGIDPNVVVRAQKQFNRRNGVSR